jgi:hypothetical protein
MRSPIRAIVLPDWPLCPCPGLVGGRGASLSRLGHFGGSQAEGAVGCREPVPTAAVTGAAAQAPATAPTQWGPAVLDLRRNSLLIVKPETVLRWHRRGWRAYWSLHSNRQHRRSGRRPIPRELQALIVRMTAENRPLARMNRTSVKGGGAHHTPGMIRKRTCRVYSV